MQRVLPSPGVKELAAKNAVGLATDCDEPEDAVLELFRKNLPDARVLPFVAFLTPAGEWIEGSSGYLEPAQLQQALERAARSPLLDAPPAVRKQLEKPAAAVKAALERGDWKPVLAAAREAAKSCGRCPERTAIQEAEQRARAWAKEQLDLAAREAGPGADVPAAKKRMSEVKRHFAGEPEGADVDLGLKAIARIHSVRGTEANGNPAPDLRAREAKAFAGTRWVVVFDKAAAGAPSDGNRQQ